MSEVKTELKLAKDAIKRKEYKEALKHCKNVLKIDKDNYNALVFVGLCAAEMKQFDQSKQAYRKAIEQNDGQILAWQGLCSLLESAKNAEWMPELKEVYSILLKHHTSDNAKWINTYDKLIVLLENEKSIKEALLWSKEALTKLNAPEEKVNCWRKIVQYLTILIKKEKDEELSKELTVSYKALIEEAESASIGAENECEKYLENLLLQSQIESEGVPPFEEVLEELKRFHSRYEDNTNIFNMLCTTLLYQTIDVQTLPGEVAAFLEKASAQQSKLGLTSHAILKYFKGAITESVSLLTKASGSSTKDHDPVGLYYLSKCYHTLHNNKKSLNVLQLCEESFRNAKFVQMKESFFKQTNCLRLENMLEQDLSDEKTLRDVNTVLTKLTSDVDINVDLTLLRAYVQLADHNKVKEMIEKMDDSVQTFNVRQKCKLYQLKAEISMQEKKYFDAELRLSEALELSNDYRTHFMFGKVYWLLGDTKIEYYQQAYSSFLKAAKLDLLYAPTFVFLGRYQKEFIKDLSKSLKCFEKAFSLDATNKDAGMFLGDMYLQYDEEEKAAKVYDVITSQAKVGEAVWAWVRFGLIHLKRKNADSAILCFQHALRGQVNVSHYWECLGDAYFTKGSYTSSLKAFKKALQLNPEAVYCKFKIGKVKQMLCLDVEAISDYEELITIQPDYIPALLGLCETHLHLLKEKLKVNFDGRAVDHAQQVLNYAAKAVKVKPTYTCLWKFLGDSLSVLHVVNNDKCWLLIPSEIQKLLSLDLEGKASKEMILEVATRCFIMAVKLREDVASYWHDLAVCTFRSGMVLQSQDGKDKIRQSMQIVKKAISLDASNHMFWNTLAVIAGSSGPSEQVCGHSIDDAQNPALSQHAFIKALELNPQDAMVWANLGLLYLKHGKIEAAHEAFKKAQSANPELVQAWVGQAYIAEAVGDDDAMDLFRHSTELTFHGESSQAYAQWVCRLLKAKQADSVLISTRPKADMSHLPKHVRRVVSNASVALQKTIARFDKDAWSYNILGLLLEHQTLYKQAEKAFSCARQLLNAQPAESHQENILRQVLLNQARVLCELSKFDDAIEIYSIAMPETAQEYCGLAYAYYASGKANKSVAAYEKALAIAESDQEKSAILAALGMMSYAMQNAELAKSLLFKSSQHKNCSEHGLMALTALGLLHGDGTLVTAALVELNKHKLCNSESFELKKTMLTSSFYMLQGQLKAAQRVLVKAVRRCRLSKFLMRNNSNQVEAAVRSSKSAQIQVPTEEIARTAAINALAYPTASSSVELVRSVQRLVHSHPGNADSWVMLCAGVLSRVVMQGKPTSAVISLINLALIKVDEQLNILRAQAASVGDKKQLAVYTNLYSWMMKLFVISNVYYGDTGTADAFCNRIVPTLAGDKSQEDFIFLKGLITFQQKRLNQQAPGLENLRVMSTLAVQSTDKWKWQIMAQIYNFMHMPVSVELCLRQQIKLNMQDNVSIMPLILRLCVLAQQVFSVCKDAAWLKKAQDSVDQLVTMDNDGPIVILLRAILFHQQENKKAALKYVNKLTYVEDQVISDLQAQLIEMWKK